MLYLERDFPKPKNCTSRNWWVQLGVWKAARFCSFGIGFGLLSLWSKRNGGELFSGISISEWNTCNEQRLEDDYKLAWINLCVEVSVSHEKLQHILLKRSHSDIKRFHSYTDTYRTVRCLVFCACKKEKCDCRFGWQRSVSERIAKVSRWQICWLNTLFSV